MSEVIRVTNDKSFKSVAGMKTSCGVKRFLNRGLLGSFDFEKRTDSLGIWNLEFGIWGNVKNKTNIFLRLSV